MSNDTNPFDAASTFMKLWSDFATKSMGIGLTPPAASTPPDMARQMRDAYLKAWSEYLDEFMRTPEYLGSVKDSMAKAIQFRQQMNDFLGQTQHSLQFATAEDVDKLMQTLQRLDRTVRTRLDELAARFDELEDRLDRLDDGAGSDDDARPRQKAKRKKRKRDED